MNESIAQLKKAVKPTRRALVSIKIPALPFRDFSFWPAVHSVFDSSANSVIIVRLNYPEAATTLYALRLLGGRRVEPFADALAEIDS